MKKKSRVLVIAHILAVFGIFGLYFIQGDIKGIGEVVSTLDSILLIIGVCSFGVLLFILWPIDLLLMARKIYTACAKGRISGLLSILSYILVLGIWERHIGLIFPVKKDFYDYLLEHTCIGQHSLLFYFVFFSGLLIGIDILLRWIRKNKTI